MPRPVTLTYRVSPSAPEVAQDAAQCFLGAVIVAVQNRGLARVAISGGSTPKAMFQLLADPNQPFLNLVPWDKLFLYWVDERCVPPTHEESNYRMTNEALLSKVPLPADHIFRMEGELEPTVAAARYEATIRNSFKLEGAQTPTFAIRDEKLIDCSGILFSPNTAEPGLQHFSRCAHSSSISHCRPRLAQSARTAFTEASPLKGAFETPLTRLLRMRTQPVPLNPGAVVADQADVLNWLDVNGFRDLS